MTAGTDLLLRRTLKANATYSIITGVVALVLAGVISDFMGVSRVTLALVGAGVAGFGGLVLWNGRRRTIDLRQARLTGLADALWVLGAVVVIAIGGMTYGGRILLALVSMPVGVFAVLQTRGIHRIEGPRRLVTEIDIDAPPSEVWQALTAFDSYPEWNPHITDARGRAEVGERLELVMATGGGRSVTMRPTVTEAVPGRSFEWLGHLGVKGVFDGRHRFDLEAVEGKTRMVHSEEFTGILVPALKSMLDGNTRAGFEAMNEAVKNRVEAKEPQEA
jgi:hypothetical protein